MNYITLSNGLRLPQVGLGTYPLKGEDLITILSHGLSAGYSLIDTAIGYGNEATIGAHLSQTDDTTLVSTKIDGLTLRRMLFPKPIRRLARNPQLSFLISDRIVDDAIESSYSRLHKIDIMLLHAPYHGCVKVYNAIRSRYVDGRLKAYGVSNFDISELKQLHDITGEWPMINQTEISPVNTQKELISFCRANGIAVEAYSPFGRGHLVKDFLSNESLRHIASSHGKSVGQVILRWIVQQGMIAIVRSSNPNRIIENTDVFDFELTAEEMSLIDDMNTNQTFGVNQVGKKTVRL
ncbi:MAG: aldo/keto reductase [Bacteroidales bacterium]|nr:aldo/keto reductase [Bacteroidales bacterium]